MSLVLYNTLRKQEEEFRPIEPGRVTMYTCGPTVYGRPHIGNYSSFLMADLLRRWLEVGHGYAVQHVKNITDVGHLVADADQGEDKVEKQAREEFGAVTHESVIGIARKYEAQYLEDEHALNILEPLHRPRATEYIDQMKAMIEILLIKEHAYVMDDGIYFDVTSKTPTAYGSLSGNTLENISSGARVEINEEKHHPADFALWKFCVGKNEHHALRWPSPKSLDGTTYPEGFPGWHIECSAMSNSLLGDQIDIHTGGEDNIFPHHECEIAQSESVTGKKPFVRLWLHKRRIDIASTPSTSSGQESSAQGGTQKMSKSLGNVLSVSDISSMGFSPLDLRYYFLSVHYRTQLKFAEKGLEDAHKARKKIMEWMEEVAEWSTEIVYEDYRYHGPLTFDPRKAEFTSAMNSDLNTPAALAAVFDLMTASRLYKDQLTQAGLESVREAIGLIRNTFGCFDPEEHQSVPADVQQLIDKRAQARASKDFAASDQLRNAIRDKGYEVRDTDGGQTVRKL